MRDPIVHARRAGAATLALRERGASLVEATIVLPIFLFAVLAILQAAMVFYAKSNLNYATYEAARAGSVHNASVASIQTAFQKALLPYYGGGRTLKELADTAARAATDLGNTAVRVEILSPTQESFLDYNSPQAQAGHKTSESVIPNVGLDELSCPRDVPGCQADPKTNKSGQTLLDANLLKVRITYGIPRAKQMPVVGRFMTWALGRLGAGTGDAFKAGLIDAGRIPIVAHTVLRMQSDPIRNSAMVSSPGPGNDGQPKDPGPAPSTGEPLPACGHADLDCSGSSSPGDPNTPPGCGDGVTLIETASADVLFDFDRATLNDAGRAVLDKLIAEAKTRTFESLTLTGYTDPLGSEAYNKQLSLDRANAVKNYLTSHGFPAKPITTVGKGEADLIKTEADCPAGPTQKACLAPNRRVVFTFDKVKD